MDGVDWRPGSYPDLSRVDVLGVGVSAVDMEPALGVIRGWIRRREAHYVCASPAHGARPSKAFPSSRGFLDGRGLAGQDRRTWLQLMGQATYRWVS